MTTNIECPRCCGEGEEPGMPISLDGIPLCTLCNGSGDIDPDSEEYRDYISGNLSVDGHEFPDSDYPDGINDSALLGDGQFPPFRIFDADAQDYLPGTYPTREEAEAALRAAIRKAKGE